MERVCQQDAEQSIALAQTGVMLRWRILGARRRAWPKMIHEVLLMIGSLNLIWRLAQPPRRPALITPAFMDGSIARNLGRHNFSPRLRQLW
jgi:hypothetical protein